MSITGARAMHDSRQFSETVAAACLSKGASSGADERSALHHCQGGCQEDLHTTTGKGGAVKGTGSPG